MKMDKIKHSILRNSVKETGMNKNNLQKPLTYLLEPIAPTKLAKED